MEVGGEVDHEVVEEEGGLEEGLMMSYRPPLELLDGRRLRRRKRVGHLYVSELLHLQHKFANSMRMGIQ